MPIFELQSNGKTYEVEAPDMKTAVSTLGGRSWADVPGEALSNLGSSAARFGEAIAQPFLHPIETAQNVGSVVGGFLDKIDPAPDYFQKTDEEKKAREERIAAADAVGAFFKDRYGSAEGIKNTLATDPVGALADASIALTGGGALAARAPGVIGRAGQAAQTAGKMIDPIQNAGKALAATGRVGSHVIGMTTGSGGQNLQLGYGAGRTGNAAFAPHLRGQAPIDDVVDMAKDAAKELRKDRSAAYQSDIATTKGSTAVLNMAPVRAAVVSALNDTTYMNLAKDKVAVRAVEEAAEIIHSFERLPYNSGKIPEAFDAMKQALGELRQRTQPGTMSRRAVDLIYNTVKKEIGKQVPEYGRAMQNYAEQTEQLKNIEKTFSLSEKASADTTLRKLQSVGRNNVNTNYGARQKLMDVLAKKQPDLPYAIAGQSLSSPTPRGLQGVAASGAGLASLATNPATLPALALFSPRLMGEAAYAAGRGARLANSVMTPQQLARALMLSYAGGQITRPTSE